MALIVQKYGGTSVADAGRIRAVAARIAASHQAGNDLVVVVSAMGDTTDRLVDLALGVSSNDHPRELDMLLTAGERISMALCAMALRDLGSHRFPSRDPDDVGSRLSRDRRHQGVPGPRGPR
jgi:aspartate kinase